MVSTRRSRASLQSLVCSKSTRFTLWSGLGPQTTKSTDVGSNFLQIRSHCGGTNTAYRSGARAVNARVSPKVYVPAPANLRGEYPSRLIPTFALSSGAIPGEIDSRASCNLRSSSDHASPYGASRRTASQYSRNARATITSGDERKGMIERSRSCHLGCHWARLGSRMAQGHAWTIGACFPCVSYHSTVLLSPSLKLVCARNPNSLSALVVSSLRLGCPFG